MRFMLTGHRGGAPTEVIADNFVSAVVSYRSISRQRVTSLSYFCEDPAHLHHPDGPWHPADELLGEIRQYGTLAGPVTVEASTPGHGHPPLADWVIWNAEREIAGYIVDSRDGDPSTRSPEDENARPFESWWGGSAGTQIGEYHDLEDAATVAALWTAKSRKL